jgi:hypothetical protein
VCVWLDGCNCSRSQVVDIVLALCCEWIGAQLRLAFLARCFVQLLDASLQ